MKPEKRINLVFRRLNTADNRDELFTVFVALLLGMLRSVCQCCDGKHTLAPNDVADIVEKAEKETVEIVKGGAK